MEVAFSMNYAAAFLLIGLSGENMNVLMLFSGCGNKSNNGFDETTDRGVNAAEVCSK